MLGNSGGRYLNQDSIEKGPEEVGPRVQREKDCVQMIFAMQKWEDEKCRLTGQAGQAQ